MLSLWSIMKEVSDNQSRQINVGREDQELGVEHVIAPYSCKYLEHDNGEDSVAFNEVVRGKVKQGLQRPQLLWRRKMQGAGYNVLSMTSQSQFQKPRHNCRAFSGTFRKVGSRNTGY
ncbi:hypothetical protein HPP92_025902 [Vanilla planifolia]|uniref:Uncharacterized protein n=1 Tax=Vanilla planifolia TaxID=51239 RepID=A0A835PID8_VANPL|nr:hypothetical protein HPP92_025902 [Vanilla planifolia]